MTSQGKYLSKLQGARVLVFGGSSGIGYGLSEALLEHGATVIISSSSASKVDGAVSRLLGSHPEAAGRISGAACDLGEIETLDARVAALFERVAGEDQLLDHVAFCAGDALAVRPLESFAGGAGEMVRAGTVRFFAPLAVARQLRRHLRPGPGSSFTVTTGGACDRPARHFSVVMGYLAGLHGMARALAVDLAPLRVNCVGLGPVHTAMWDPLREAGAYDAYVARMEANMTTGTFGRVEDVVETYLYLMKDRNVSGSVVNSNGGAFLTAGKLW